MKKTILISIIDLFINKFIFYLKNLIKNIGIKLNIQKLILIYLHLDLYLFLENKFRSFIL